jgi:hypothetical protein
MVSALSSPSSLSSKVPEEQQSKGKGAFKNFKKIVCHKAFYQLLISIEPLSKTGYHLQYDGTELHIFPYVLILSADYEEQ